MKDCTTCKYGYEDERLGIQMCHHPKRFEDCVDFNMHEEKEIKESEKPTPNDLEEAAKDYTDSSEWFIGENLEHIEASFIAGAKWQKDKMMKDAVKWLVDDDYDELTDKGRFILGSVGIGYNGYYIPYSDLLKLPKEDEQ